MEFKIRHKDFIISGTFDGDIRYLIESRDLSKSISPKYLEFLSRYEDDMFETLKQLVDSHDYNKEPYCAAALILQSILYTILYRSLNKDLYFFESESGLIKIGISQNVGKRIKQVSGEVKSKLKVIKVLSGYSMYEKDLHRIFEDINIPYMGQTEWFHPTTDLILFIGKVNEKNITKLCRTRLKKVTGRKKIS